MLQWMVVVRWRKGALAAEMIDQLPFPVMGGDAQARTGLMQIDQNARAFAGNGLHRGVDKLLAIAIERTKDVAIGTMRMHAHQHIGLVGNVPVDQCQVAFSVDTALIANGAELASRCAQVPLGVALNKA